MRIHIHLPIKYLQHESYNTRGNFQEIKCKSHNFWNFQEDNYTSVKCESSALIVLSMFALQFHLRIDIKELSFTNSKSGKDLPMDRNLSLDNQ